VPPSPTDRNHPHDSSLREQWYRSGDGFVFVFSVTDRDTFDELPKLYEEVRRAREEDRVPCVVVANKCDLKDKRVVCSTEARALAKKFNCPFIETSAKTGVNIDVAFQQCARRVQNHNVSRK
jgi:GTPase KRas protein